ncbi:MAG: AbiV family abortive infection protein [Caulobacter sp.]|nr:AbiV family abortive infection protein [Caulobacter sp.]
MTKLTLPTVLTAMVKSASNAADLAADANLLLGARRYVRAFMLLHCAAEELAKYFMLEALARKMALKAPINWGRFWKRIRSHDSKMAHAATRLEAMSAQIAPAKLDAARAGTQIWSHAGTMPRNQALYVEIEEGTVRAPSDIDWSIGVKGLEALVETLLEGARAVGTTEDEIAYSLKRGAHGDFLAPYLLQLRRWREAGLSEAEATDRVKKIWALTTNAKIRNSD